MKIMRWGVYELLQSGRFPGRVLISLGLSETMSAAVRMAHEAATGRTVVVIDHDDFGVDEPEVFMLRRARRISWEARCRGAAAEWDRKWLLIESASRRLRDQAREELVEEMVQAVFDVLAGNGDVEFPE